MLFRSIIESHIFRPSPLYTNKYESLNRRYGIELKADNTILVSSSNFDLGKRRLRIISQEDVYNSRWKRNFTILITPTFLSDDISGVPLLATRSLPSVCSEVILSHPRGKQAFLK